MASNSKAVMRASPTALLSLALLCCAGCATPYQSNGFVGGFNDTQLAPDVFRVSFRGNGYTGADQVQDFALLRCAELTLKAGYSCFAIVKENETSTPVSFSTESTTTTTGNVSVNGNEANYSQYATTIPGQTFTFFKPTSGLLIRCFSAKPEGVFTFDAAFLRDSIGQKYGVGDLKPANATRLDPNTYQVTVDARAPWIHTGIEVKTGQKIRFNSDGEWGESPGVSRSANGGAAGIFGSGYWGVLRRVPDAPWGALVGRVGTTKFLIGIAATITTREDGELLLGINMGENNLADGHGSQMVKIQLLP